MIASPSLSAGRETHALERAVVDLQPERLGPFEDRRPADAGDAEPVVLDADLDVRLFDAGQLRDHREAVGLAKDVDAGPPAVLQAVAGHVEEPGDAVDEVVERVDGHGPIGARAEGGRAMGEEHNADRGPVNQRLPTLPQIDMVARESRVSGERW